ncbi:MAG: hypothetical protein AAGD06_12345 [Acidobacteriota bacterium]
MDYPSYYQELGFDQRLIDISTASLRLPGYVFQPPRWTGFPPALLPLWFKEGAFFGYWRHWFCPERTTSLVEHVAEDSWYTLEVARSPDQLFARILLDRTDERGMDDDDLKFAEEVGLSDLVEGIEDAYARGYGDYHALVTLAPFTEVLAPLKCFEYAGKQHYRGDWPWLGDPEIVSRGKSLCEYEVSDLPEQLEPLRQSLPPWFGKGDKQPVFDALLAKSDFRGCWMCLNSIGWTYSAAKSSILRLAERVGDDGFGAFAEMWAGNYHEEYDEY